MQRAVASRALQRHDSLILPDDDSEDEEDEEGGNYCCRVQSALSLARQHPNELRFKYR